MRCKTCHYSLTGLGGSEHRCPECGRAFDPAAPETFLTDTQFRSLCVTRGSALAGVSLLILLIVLLAYLQHMPMLLLFMVPPLVVGILAIWNAKPS